MKHFLIFFFAISIMRTTVANTKMETTSIHTKEIKTPNEKIIVKESDRKI